MKFLLMVVLLGPMAGLAQLPVPISPDFLRPAQQPAEVLHSTAVTLMENNFRVVEADIVATSRGFKLLGFITIKSASHTKAMTRLYKQAHVEVGRPQSLANVVHESGGMNLILFSLPKVTVRADLIEFTSGRHFSTNAPRETSTNAPNTAP